MLQSTRLRTIGALLFLILFTFCISAIGEVTITIKDSSDAPADVTQDSQSPSNDAADTAVPVDPSTREAFIDGILSLAKEHFETTNGRAQRAHYSGDIYLCKNFTVYLFKENASKFRMAEFPNVPLVIPNNRPKKECIETAYGAEWEDVPASDGNPFLQAASFRYNTDKSKAENKKDAREFLMQVKRGDFFQMVANYYYGVGAHSMLFIADYDPATDRVHWTDSNMKGESRNGERYGYVQYDAVKEIDWFVDAFCRKKHGATLYRLRDDIIQTN